MVRYDDDVRFNVSATFVQFCCNISQLLKNETKNSVRMRNLWKYFS